MIENITLYTLVWSILVIVGLISLLLGQAKLLSFSLFSDNTFDTEKYSPYECGFAPFQTERAQFDIKFYLVALLFLVFDVELMFLLPYCLSYTYLGLFGYTIFIIFFSILLLGFLVEWAAGMLVWKDEVFSNFNNFKSYVQPYNLYQTTYISYIDKSFINKRYSFYRKMSYFKLLRYRT